MASMSRSFDLIGSDWGLRKKPQRQTYKKAWDLVGPALLMRDAGDTLHLQEHLFIQQVWESRMKGRLHSHGSSRQQEQHSCGMLLFTAGYPDFVNMPCFSCKAALLNLASPWLGLCLSARGPLTEPWSCQSLSPLPQTPYLQSSLADPCSPPLCLGPCLFSTKVFDMALHMSKFFLSLFSYWSPTEIQSVVIKSVHKSDKELEIVYIGI
jgi:hypothetical protein